MTVANVYRTAPRPLFVFDYACLSAEIAHAVDASAKYIRQFIKRTLKGAIVIGQQLLAVKQALPHGQFGPWLQLEFGWKEGTARNFMAVAAAFGPKTAIVGDLAIEPTAAYLLAG